MLSLNDDVIHTAAVDHGAQYASANQTGIAPDGRGRNLVHCCIRMRAKIAELKIDRSNTLPPEWFWQYGGRSDTLRAIGADSYLALGRAFVQRLLSQSLCLK
ncbi:hypothetical protein PoB_002152200 [Plakobranchus ocellatus]|uniref:Uncharacterized protein n=1 Tax=Plakobranchus ocellatus TaxID=259542 RepID=A0AAV3ZKF0_9GAST|nr:hypothetical protein PoB_002152200 [Plakobranchus ocellatus]